MTITILSNNLNIKKKIGLNNENINILFKYSKLFVFNPLYYVFTSYISSTYYYGFMTTIILQTKLSIPVTICEL